MWYFTSSYITNNNHVWKYPLTPWQSEQAQRGRVLWEKSADVLIVHLITSSFLPQGPSQRLCKEEVGGGGTVRARAMLTKDLMLTEGMLIIHSISTGLQIKFREQSTCELEYSQRIEVNDKVRWGKWMCVYTDPCIWDCIFVKQSLILKL